MKPINWTNICTNVEVTDAQLLMADMKVFIIMKRQLVPCDGTGGLGRPHKMRYLLLGNMQDCHTVLTCQELNRVSVKEHGIHETQSNPH
ncbi:hypothetical protein PHMEG_00018243 [Phytophthora megakarya]|uniref:Uncharacterized protein n=1 Tax=Phytophthora megakarya TaxID=4795 RepID=A0A225VUT2_9STRA|nr:hypothetical protein PHMEG_00018243 [Phytophthora megakarya]